jgi:DNA-binding HxlR family transcriptional regulator
VGKKFDQYCPMAHALSLVGERWALLIVRELLHGPKRYTDLAYGLPGIGTNILAALERCFKVLSLTPRLNAAA